MEGILKASYGDRAQREQNVKPIDHALAKDIQQAAKLRKQLISVPQVSHGTLHYSHPRLLPYKVV